MSSGLQIVACAMLLAQLATSLAAGQIPELTEVRLPWETLAKRCPAGVETLRWQALVSRMQTNGFTLPAAEDCLQAVGEAMRLNLPVETVLMRIEEGAAKCADAAAVRDAGQQRVASLQTALLLLQKAGYGCRNGVHDQLLQSVAAAYEGGVCSSTLQATLTCGHGGQSERMRAVIVAGEAMCLAGVSEPVLGEIMLDCVTRGLRRLEVMRACRFVINQHQTGVEGAEIRRRLWAGPWEGGGPVDGSSGKELPPASLSPVAPQ